MKNRDFNQLRKYNEKQHDINKNKLNISLGYAFSIEDDKFMLSFKRPSVSTKNEYYFYYSDSTKIETKYYNVILMAFRRHFEIIDNNIMLNEKQYYFFKFLFENKYNNVLFDYNQYYNGHIKYSFTKTMDIIHYILRYVKNIDGLIEKEIIRDNKLFLSNDIQKCISDNLKLKYEYVCNANNFDLI